MPELDAMNGWLKTSYQMWSRIQTVTAIEAGTLVGWYSLQKSGDSALALALLLFAMLLLICMSLLMFRDGQYMCAFEDACGTDFPRVAKPLIGLGGRDIATWLPVGVGVLNLLILSWCDPRALQILIPAIGEIGFGNLSWSIAIGVTASIVATVLILFLQWLYVWSQAGRLVGEWNAYKRDDGRWAAIPGSNITKISRDTRPPWRASHLLVDSRDYTEGGTADHHNGEILLDAPHCRHGIRTIEYDRGGRYVQEIWITTDMIAVKALWAGIPLNQLDDHILVLRDSDLEKRILKGQHVQ